MTENFIPYGRQTIDQHDLDAVCETLKNDYLTQGPKIAEFEKAITEYTGAKFCVAVANGTAALHLSVAALNLPTGSQGLTSPITFVASANCLPYNGIKPGFSDIDPETGNIDPALIPDRMTENTSVIIPVHYSGRPVDMKSVHELASRRGIRVIEDAAHAIGSRYSDGGMVGNCRYSDLTIFSFHPVKTMTTGEGGAITTNSDELYRRLQLLRSHGITRDPDQLSDNPGPWYYEMQDLGYNYRLTDLQAALGLSQLSKLERFIERRREITLHYQTGFSRLSVLKTPAQDIGTRSAWHLYVIRLDLARIGISRKSVMEKLKKAGIGTQVHYIPVHLQPYYQKHYGFRRGDFPNAESFYEECLSLPLYPGMTNQDVDRVVAAVQSLEKESHE